MICGMPDETTDEQQPRRWVILAVFSDPLEARMAAAKLEEEEIDTSVGDQRDLTTLFGVTLGAAQIGVAEEDFIRAADILGETPARSKLCERPGEDALACPKCGLVAAHRPAQPSVLGSIARGLGGGSRAEGQVRCANCGTVWTA